jgi:hypothetical protein
MRRITTARLYVVYTLCPVGYPKRRKDMEVLIDIWCGWFVRFEPVLRSAACFMQRI